MLLYIAIIVGFLLSTIFTNHAVLAFLGAYYQIILNFIFASALYGALAIGLYGATSSIYIHELRKNIALIIRAVTIGVILKSLIIGVGMWFLFKTPYAFVFGITVAQIDPLAVVYLQRKKKDHFSDQGRTILRAWSSFDDPMTVLLALYVYLPFVLSGNNQGFSSANYFFQLGVNLFFALAAFVIFKQLRDGNGKQLVLLGIAFATAVVFKLMFGIAMIGLFLRPRIKILTTLITISFAMAALLVGILLEVTSMHLLYGAALGVLAFAAQIITTYLVAPRLAYKDKIFLAFSQYNGITAIVLSLVLTQWIPGIASVVAIGVVVINSLYYISNWLLGRKFR